MTLFLFTETAYVKENLRFSEESDQNNLKFNNKQTKLLILVQLSKGSTQANHHRMHYSYFTDNFFLFILLLVALKICLIDPNRSSIWGK